MPTVTSVTKHFPVSKEGFTTTLASTIGSGAATVPLNSVTGYSNGDTVVLVVDPGNSKKQAFTGTIDTAGVQVTGVVWTEGTNDTHTAGATVVDYVTATHMAMVTKGLKRDHNDSGYHKTLNDDNGNEWLKQSSTPSAVNEVTLANAATGNAPSFVASGGDSNIDIKMTGKGTGKAYTDGFSEIAYDFVVSGLVWTGDAYGSTRAASMTAGSLYVSGVRVTLAAVAARTFTASRDTYVDVTSAGVVTYTEVVNNAASPALAANSIRIAIIVTGAGSIANAAAINQGQIDKILPISGSIPYTVADSLGNLICSRDPANQLRAYRVLPGDSASGTTGSLAAVTGLTATVKNIPAGRKVKITVHAGAFRNSGGAGVYYALGVRRNSDSKTLSLDSPTQSGAGYETPMHMDTLDEPNATETYQVIFASNSGTTTVVSKTNPTFGERGESFLKVELD